MPRRNLIILLATGVMTIFCYHKAESIGRTQYGRMFSNFAQVMDEIEQNYVRKVDRQDLFDTAMQGMVSSLDDHSDYFSAKELEALGESLNRRFIGIGIRVSTDPDTKLLMVSTPMVGSPGHKAGLAAGDLILAINGVSTLDKTSSECSDLIRGEEGTVVTLTVRHYGTDEAVEIDVERADIPIPSVEGDRYLPSGMWDFRLEQEPQIAYIRMNAFVNETLNGLSQALTELRNKNIKGVILDVRDNPGGRLEVAVDMCNLFLNSGVIVSTKGRDGIREIYEASDTGTEPSYPMAILVNGESASASEILAAALQDHRRAIVVGQRTYGKGSVQSVMDLVNGDAALKLTIAEYRRPSGENIHRHEGDEEDHDWGVRPNPGYEVPLTLEEWVRLKIQRQRRDVFDPTGRMSTAPNDQNGGPIRAPDQTILDPQLQRAIKAIYDQIRNRAGRTEPA
ncbi:MAG: S41 family peptidase [Pirellulales bacterium]|nr:S41 family peptidase [Pirellulales bacterium]